MPKSVWNFWRFLLGKPAEEDVKEREKTDRETRKNNLLFRSLLILYERMRKERKQDGMSKEKIEKFVGSCWGLLPKLQADKYLELQRVSIYWVEILENEFY